MTNAELHERLRVNILGFKWLQGQTANLHTHTRPGVVAFAVPGRGDLLFQQQIMFEHPTALAEALEPLEQWYLSQQVPAWRVPVLPGDEASATALAHAGYRPELVLPAMALTLASAPPPQLPPGITLEHPENLDAVLELNGRCYGVGLVSFLAGWRSPPLPGHQLHAVLVREAGEALACGLSFEQGDTAGIYFVATHERARRRGLGTLVMQGLHADARARDCRFAVLQSSPLGHNLYRQLGYQELGGWTNWVKRAPGAAPA
jgi:GNAT superfamily N-acetyltransferase